MYNDIILMNIENVRWNLETAFITLNVMLTLNFEPPSPFLNVIHTKQYIDKEVT